MDKTELVQYRTKRVKLFLKNRDLYHGEIISIGDTSFTIRDKFGETISISFDSVSLIKEDGGNRNDY